MATRKLIKYAGFDESDTELLNEWFRHRSQQRWSKRTQEERSAFGRMLGARRIAKRQARLRIVQLIQESLHAKTQQ